MSKRTGRRANGEGSLYFDERRRLWRGAVQYRDPSTGKSVRKYVSHRTQAGARERLTEMRRQLDIGQQPVSGSVTAGDYLDHWLVALRARVKPSTWRAHELAVRRYLKPALGRTRLSRLSPTDVERMMASEQAKGHSATARNARATLRQALNDAVRDGAISRNVAARARPPRQEPREMRVLDAAQVAVLLEATSDEDLGPLIATLVLTGMRSGDALALGWADLDERAATLSVKHTLARDWDGQWRRAGTKTERSRRSIHLPDAALQAFRVQGHARSASA